MGYDYIEIIKKSSIDYSHNRKTLGISIISNEKLWRVASALYKPIAPELLVGPLENPPNTPSKGSSIFAEAFTNKPVGGRSKIPMQKSRLILSQTANSSSDELTPSGLHRNHRRRAEPLLYSEVLGKSFKFSQVHPTS